MVFGSRFIVTYQLGTGPFIIKSCIIPMKLIFNLVKITPYYGQK